ncbi:hypothetical protein AtubIFM57258_008488 [Aspergillus tubingensis]|nr:hypothetical protein AtubIFM57258_008488 [Aspergillus tubingensis]
MSSEKESAPNAPSPLAPPPPSDPPRRDWRFWAIFPPLCVATLLSALESTVVSTALPSIVDDLHSGNLYIWFVNGYFLTFTAFQPLYGQLAQVFGRRWLLIGAVAIFALGSGISGGASSSAMLLVGRVLQGAGGGGISLMTQLVISDLVSVRERGKFMAIIFTTFSLGTSLGPFIGGALVDNTTWRWVFYINLPIAGAALVLLYFFLQVHFQRRLTVRQKMSRIDFVGNAILIASVTSILIALSWGGSRYSWRSWHVLVPLLVGFAGTGFFHFYESTRFCKEPTLPTRILANNRTTSIVLFCSFCQFLLSFWTIYFLPIYFQGVLLVSPERSGVLLLPFVITSLPIAMLFGNLLTRWGRYKPIHIVAFMLITLGTGLFVRLDQHSSMAEYVIFQIITAVGTGMIMSTLLPAVQAPLQDTQVAPATATWGFLRAYGGVWGVAIPGAIFNSQIQTNLSKRVSDPDVRRTLGSGSAYSHVSSSYIRSLPADVRDDVVSVYVDALRIVWATATAFAGLCFLLTLLEKEVPLRTSVKSDYGMRRREQEKTTAGDSNGNAESSQSNSSPVASSTPRPADPHSS